MVRKRMLPMENNRTAATAPRVPLSRARFLSQAATAAATIAGTDLISEHGQASYAREGSRPPRKITVTVSGNPKKNIHKFGLKRHDILIVPSGHTYDIDFYVRLRKGQQEDVTVVPFTELRKMIRLGYAADITDLI